MSVNEKLAELLTVCVEKELYFSFVGDFKLLSVSETKNGEIKPICTAYSLYDYNGTEEQHIAYIESLIQQIKEM